MKRLGGAKTGQGNVYVAEKHGKRVALKIMQPSIDDEDLQESKARLRREVDCLVKLKDVEGVPKLVVANVDCDTPFFAMDCILLLWNKVYHLNHLNYFRYFRKQLVSDTTNARWYPGFDRCCSSDTEVIKNCVSVSCKRHCPQRYKSLTNHFPKLINTEDIKPRNIVGPVGEWDKLHLIDFGIAYP